MPIGRNGDHGPCSDVIFYIIGDIDLLNSSLNRVGYTICHLLLSGYTTSDDARVYERRESMKNEV